MPVSSSTLTGTFSNLLGQSYATITIPTGVTVASVTVNGTQIASANYNVTGSILSIMSVVATDTIKVTAGNGTIYTVVSNSSNNPTTTPSAITIRTIDNITATVNKGNGYVLPSTVQATMSNGSIQQVAVTCDNQVNTSQAGTFTFNGTVKGYSGSVNLTLIVKNITDTANDFSITYVWNNGAVAPKSTYFGNIKIDSNFNCKLTCTAYGKTTNKQFKISLDQENTLYQLMVNNRFNTKRWTFLTNVPGGTFRQTLIGTLNGKVLNVPAYLNQNDSQVASHVYKFINDLIQANLAN